MEENNPLVGYRLNKLPVILGCLCFFARLVLLLAMPMEGLLGYGDYRNYYLNASLNGWPFLHYWAEYPPLFPLLSEALYRLATGQQHVYVYLLQFLMLAADAGNAFLFSRLAVRLFSTERAVYHSVIYLVTLLSLAYSWWYFEPLVVFSMLLSLTLLLERKMTGAALSAGMGIITKFFPGMALLAAWRRLAWKQAALLIALSLTPLAVSYGILWGVSPEFTAASLRSQSAKGSWQTVWALLDGNYQTGNFGALEERFDPARALVPQGNPAVVPPLASLFAIGGIGLLAMLRMRPPAGSNVVSDRQSIALVGFGWCLFALWLPGWSPQWVLYLLPLLLLALPLRQGILFGAVMVLVDLLEWPVLLSRSMFWGLWVTIPLRTVIMALLAVSFFPVMRGSPR